METRSFASFEVRKDASTGARTLEGIAVPWDQEIQAGEYRERFQRGAFADYAGGAKLYAEHGHLRGEFPIGVVTEVEDREEGLFVRARISKTVRGDEAYELLRDGAVSGLSIGFKPVEDQDDNGVVVRTKAEFGEVSITSRAAYAGAAVTAVRHQPPAPSQPVPPNQEGPSMTATTPPTPPADTADLTELRSSVEDLTRRFTVIEQNGPAAPADSGIQVRSLAEFVKMLADHKSRPAGFDPRAEAELITRAYTGAVISDSNARPAWIDRDIKLVSENRDVLNLFSKAPLPATGMNVEYPKFGSKTGDVAEQVNEGDDLTYLELTVTDASAPVKTYGGYSSLSRQAIERADVPYLAKVLDMQKISYAKVTNGAIRTLLQGSPATYNQETISLADSTKAQAWVQTVLSACAKIHSNSTGLEADVWLMGLDQFKALAAIVDSAGRPVFVINGDGSNTVGSVNVRGLSANVAGLPVKVDLGMSGTSSYVCSADAITVMESGGAPFQLQDENIINLTKDFSLYGYLAATRNDDKGVTRVLHAAA